MKKLLWVMAALFVSFAVAAQNRDNEGRIIINSAEEFLKIGTTGYPSDGKYIQTANIDLGYRSVTSPIISGAFSSRISFIIKDIDNSYILSLFTSILMVICGVVLIINPGNTALVITTLIGIILIVYSVSAIVDMFIFKSRVKEIDKYFSKLLK